MRTSEHTDIIDAALATAQGVIENPTKDAKNSHFGNRYATLDVGLNVVRPSLSKAGISVTQATRVEDGVLMLDTRLACQGQWIEAEYPVCVFPAKPQELGSALTYARRYSLFSLVGIAGEEDDDGNAANSTATPAPKRNSHKVSPETSAVAKDAAMMAISMAQNLEILQSWAVDHKVEMDRMLDADVAEVRKAYKSKHDELKKEAAQ